jgi:hypothetical protein
MLLKISSDSAVVGVLIQLQAAWGLQGNRQGNWLLLQLLIYNHWVTEYDDTGRSDRTGDGKRPASQKKVVHWVYALEAQKSEQQNKAGHKYEPVECTRADYEGAQ